MQRYVVLAWPVSDAQSSDAAARIALRLQSASREWRRVLAGSGLIALHATSGPADADLHTLPGGSGLVFGRLFARPGDSISPLAAGVDGDATALIQRGWGRYVALLLDDDGRVIRVLRDPSGGLPCFVTRLGRVHVFFSDVGDLLRTGLFAFSVDWRHIERTAVLSVAHVRSTGLDQVVEVQPGECFEVRDGSSSRRALWKPAAIVQSDPIEDSDTAASELATTVKACVDAWAAPHRSVLHNLSGGLDSSIVLACLARSAHGPAITCLNYFLQDPEADERRHARIAAAALGCSLVEREMDARAVKLERVLAIAHSPKPWFYLYDIEHGQFELRLAIEREATAMFFGAGGDSVFYLGRTGLAAIDFARAHGIRPALLRIAHDAARIERTTVWPLLLASVRAAWGPAASWDPLADTAQSRTLLTRDVIDEVRADPQAIHPWLQDADERVPPGKRWHLLSMGTPLPYYDAFGRRDAPERILPLMSQPVVELVLRIPTYALIAGGRNRALARRAFANDLPPEIEGRRGKGGSDAHIRHVLEANLDFVRNLLLDGMLVRRGILDRGKLEAFLADRTQEGTASNEIVQDYVSIEAWLARWDSTSRGRPAS